MRNAYLVRLPMGTGKTRLVLRKILNGAGKHGAAWNRRLQRTLIVGPNHYVHRGWWRELLLLGRERGLVSGLHEEDIRDMSLAKLRRTLAAHGIASPAYRTYRMLARQRVGHWHYVVLDEWHRITWKLVRHCVTGMTNRAPRPWFVGGRGIAKDLFFVSATPVNPVLEDDEEVQESAVDETSFQERVRDAIVRAAHVLQGFTGRRAALGDRFFDVVAGLRVKELTGGKLRWVLPKPILGGGGGPTSAEMELVRACVRDDVEWAREYARMVGLVRTTWDRHARVHRLSRSLAGRRKSFGKAYATVDVVRDGRGRPPAWKYLREEHPRCARLLDVLRREEVIAETENGTALTKRAKALIFCTHRGVALGLVEMLNQILGHHAADTNIDAIDVDAVTRGFNKRTSTPHILVATDVLSEGIDLHWACKLLVHYELPWSPLRLFQRIGRLTGRKGKVGFNRNVRVAHILVPGSVEEERVNRLIRRIDFLGEQALWPTRKPTAVLAQALVGGGPSLHLSEATSRSDG
jgi:Helicase conserved C-terminal domain